MGVENLSESRGAEIGQAEVYRGHRRKAVQSALGSDSRILITCF
jgi:hypothetical protein